jgi:hypothetical protein
MGQKSMSADHVSYSSFSPNPESTPIVLLGFARSGTTTFQNHLARSLEYNFAFEPIGFNHSNYSAQIFRQITRLFRNAPDLDDQKEYQIDGGTFAALHLIRNEITRDPYRGILEDYLGHILGRYGRNVVIKEVRLLFNVPTLLEIFSLIGVPALFVFLRSNPLMTLYTYYRLGGLIEKRDYFDLRVDEIYAYYQMITSSLPQFSDLTFKCQNKWEKLLVSVALYQRVMEQLVSRYPENCYLANFESIDNDLKAIALRIGNHLTLPHTQLISKSQRFARDPLFLQSARHKLSLEVLGATGVSLPEHPETTTQIKQRLHYRVTRLQNRLLEI